MSQAVADFAQPTNDPLKGLWAGSGILEAGPGHSKGAAVVWTLSPGGLDSGGGGHWGGLGTDQRLRPLWKPEATHPDLKALC